LIEYATRALLSLEKDETDRRTDGRQTATLRLPLDATSVKKIPHKTSPIASAFKLWQRTTGD